MHYNRAGQTVKHPDWYEGVVPKDCLVKVPTIKGLDPEEMKEYNIQ